MTRHWLVVVLLLVLFATTTCQIKVQEVEEEEEEEDDGNQLKTMPLVRFRDTLDEPTTFLFGIDGTVTAVALSSGRELWKFVSESPLHGASGSSNGAVAGMDGSIYVYSADAAIRVEKLPVSVRELVHSSPFVDDDGNVYVGTKSTTVYAIDVRTGELKLHFSAERVGNVVQDDEAFANVMYVGRSDYSISVFDGRSGRERWNMSMGEFVVHVLANETTTTTTTASPAYIVNTLPGQQRRIDSLSAGDDAYDGNEFLPPHWLFDADSMLASPNDADAAPLVVRMQNPLLLDGAAPPPPLQINAQPKPQDIYSQVITSVYSMALQLHWSAALALALATLAAFELVRRVRAKRRRRMVAAERESAAREALAKQRAESDAALDQRDERGYLKRGSLAVSRDVLGYGSHGTIVFRGEHHGRQVAVKRLLSAFYDVAEKEVLMLLQADEHPNVVQYFARERDDQFVYLAVSLCSMTLEQWIGANGDSNGGATRQLFEQIMAGVAHLHSMHIVHRDLRPANILIDANERGKISDMGLAKRLEFDQYDFSSYGAPSSTGYQAPEVLLRKSSRRPGRAEEAREKEEEKEERIVAAATTLSKKIDIFALGCILYNALSGGQHPFGSVYERELNIRRNRVDLSALDGDLVARDLAAQMLCPTAAQRPNAEQVLDHPFFWDDHKKLLFLRDASDRLEIEPPSAPIVRRLEASAPHAVSADWSSVLPEQLTADLGKYRKYKYNHIRDLLRVVRNKFNHYRDLPEPLQRELGALPGPFLRFFDTRFPHLFCTLYHLIRSTPCVNESSFSVYFAHGAYVEQVEEEEEEETLEEVVEPDVKEKHETTNKGKRKSSNNGGNRRAKPRFPQRRERPQVHPSRRERLPWQ
jgi:serine/threonine protein kinase